MPSLEELLASFADSVAARVLERMAAPRPVERISVDAVTEHGAPSVRWLRDKARAGLVTLHGPRGGRFVLRTDLEALLAQTSLKRTSTVPDAETSVAEDAAAAVAEMARKRAG